MSPRTVSQESNHCCAVLILLFSANRDLELWAPCTCVQGYLDQDALLLLSVTIKVLIVHLELLCICLQMICAQFVCFFGGWL